MKKRDDLKGQHIGHLTVLERSDKRGVRCQIIPKNYEYDSDFVKLICCDILGRYTNKYKKTHSNYKPHDAKGNGNAIRKFFPYLNALL